jgi:hypothetical protein
MVTGRAIAFSWELNFLLIPIADTAETGKGKGISSCFVAMFLIDSRKKVCYYIKYPVWDKKQIFSFGLSHAVF